MPESALVHAQSRFFRRLAEGLRRTRLIEPILAARPPLVVIGAPSGYGKTVLAAQIASSGGYADVLWISASVADSLESQWMRIRLHLVPRDGMPACITSSEPSNAFGSEAARPSSAHGSLVVLDGMDEICTAEGLRAAFEIVMEAAPGSSIVITTRIDGGTSLPLRDMCVLDSSLLSLNDDDLAGMWRLHSTEGPCSLEMVALRSASGGHAGLASLACRRLALLGRGALSLDGDFALAAEVRQLAELVSDSESSRLLHVIAAAKHGTVELLADSVPSPGMDTALQRAFCAVPLFEFHEADALTTFTAEPLLVRALRGAKWLAVHDPVCLRSLALSLVAQKRSLDALAVSIDSGCTELVADILRLVGGELVVGADAPLVRAGLHLVSAAHVSGDPILLTLLAEDDWHCGRTLQALGTARLASRLAEADGNSEAMLKARLTVARLRASVGDFEGISAELLPLLETWRSIIDTEDVCALVSAGLLAYGFLGDRQGLSKCMRIVSEIVTLPCLTSASLSRLDAVQGLVMAVLDGDYPASHERSRRAASRTQLSLNQQVGAVSNVATAALLAGMLSEAKAAAEHGLSMAVGRDADASVVASMTLARAVASGLGGDGDALHLLQESAIEAELRGSDRFSLTSALIVGSLLMTLFRKVEAARLYSDRAVIVALEMGSPVLLWLAELVQAQACLAIGEVDRAAKTATRLLPRVEAIAAMGHVLHARMILAEVALRGDDLATALEHLSAVSDHIVEKTPALAVAAYLRSFPDLLGPLTHVIGAERLPLSILRCLNGIYAAEAFESAAKVLTRAEMATLKNRMQTEAGQGNRGREAAATDEPVVEVKLFGGLEVKAAHGIVAQRDWGKRKARILFAMLVARHGTDIHRAELIEYLWPELDEPHGINNFYVVWSAMKRAVSPQSIEDETSPPFENHNGVCRMIPGRIVSDLDLFTAARAEARCAKGTKDTEAEIKALRAAIELYRGDVLPGDIYDDWFGGIRQRFRQEYQASVIRFAELMLASDDPLAALPFVIEASERDPLREDLYQVRIRLEVGSNQRGAAMGTYMSCRHTLIEELGVDPSRETVELYNQILAMEDGPDSKAS